MEHKAVSGYLRLLLVKRFSQTLSRIRASDSRWNGREMAEKKRKKTNRVEKNFSLRIRRRFIAIFISFISIYVKFQRRIFNLLSKPFVINDGRFRIFLRILWRRQIKIWSIERTWFKRGLVYWLRFAFYFEFLVTENVSCVRRTVTFSFQRIRDGSAQFRGT